MTDYGLLEEAKNLLEELEKYFKIRRIGNSEANRMLEAVTRLTQIMDKLRKDLD